jgi:hypothetical protein
MALAIDRDLAAAHSGQETRERREADRGVQV